MNHIVWTVVWSFIFGIALHLFDVGAPGFYVLTALFVIGIVATRMRYYHLGLCRRYEK